MALYCMNVFSSASFQYSPVVGSSSNKIPINEDSNLTNLSSLRPTTTAQKLRIAQNNNLLSVFTPQQPFTCVNGKQDEDNINFQVHEQKLNIFRQVLRKVGEDPIEGLNMIDAIQRLGIEYKFEEEIDEILQTQFLIFSAPHQNSSEYYFSHDLRELALRFRLLRQHGYSVPCGVLISKFKSNKDEIRLKKLHTSDQGKINGLMSLYEASQLSIKGEEELEETGNFCFQIISSSMANFDPHLARVMGNTLSNPHHRSLSKFMAINFFGNCFGEANGWINVLQDVAKMEFNFVQSLHQDELVQIYRWWRDLNLVNDLKLARDQIANKCYVWSMACLTDPSLSKQRIQLTKVISFIYLMDDIFDVYGTLNQLILFTEAVNRWDINVAEEPLPECMEMYLKALFEITNEISHDINRMHGWNPQNSLQKTWSVVCNAFLEEAKWFGSGHVPKPDEYLKNGMVSSGVHVVLIHILFMVESQAGINTEPTLLLVDMPAIISSTATILRLWDDLGTAKDEKQEGHDGSYMECYLKEHKGSSVEESREEIRNLISDAWKSLNKECLSPKPFSTKFTNASLNLARLVPIMYNYDENQSLPRLEQLLKSLLYEKDTI